MYLLISKTLVFFFFLSLFNNCNTASKETTNKEGGELSERFGAFDWFRPPARERCRTRRGQNGLCGPLNQCPALQSEVRRNPSRVMQEYSCSYSRSTFVCCPESANLEKIRDQPPSWGGSADNGRPAWTNPSRPPNGNDWNNNDNRRPPATESSPSAATWSWPDWSSQTTTPRTFIPSVRPTTFTSGTSTAKATFGGRRTEHPNRKLLPEATCGFGIGQKVFGGEETGLEELPWMALLRLRFNSGRTAFMCGGSLISSRYVLTAAHCIKGSNIPSSATIDQVRLGEHDTNSTLDCLAGGGCSAPPDDIDIEERIVHPKYNPRQATSKNDIALLRLRRDAKISAYVQPICLPLDDLENESFDRKGLVTAGWGRTEKGQKSNVKLKVDLPAVPLTECSPRYRAENVNIDRSQLCAGGIAGKDSCQGDSGGPLMSQDLVGPELRWHVVGLVSYGPKKCGEANRPAVYTRVTSFIKWILDNMKP